MDILLQLFLIVFFIALNGFFVISEYALVSVRRTRIETLVREGNKKAVEVSKAIAHLPTYISATQLGITFASIALGWVGEPVFTTIFSFIFQFFPSVPLHVFPSTLISIVFAFLFVTFLEVVFGELAPKTTALERPEQVAFVIITPLRFFTVIFRPFIWLLRITSEFFLKMIGISPSGKSKTKALSEEEIKLILSQSAASGIIEQQEVEMINKVFWMGDLPISTIMVPISDVIAFNEQSSIYEIARSITENNLHTRFPIYEYSRENIIGFVSVMDIYTLSKELPADKVIRETKLVRKIVAVKESMRIDDVLVFLKKTGVHLGVVVDDKKETIGIISIEDIIESLVGEIKEK